VSEDHFTKPERAYQRMQGKRHMAAIRDLGLCFSCKWRDKEQRGAFGMWKCNGYDNRMELHCDRDGLLPKYAYDDDTVERLAAMRAKK
jgi:ribosomal protein L37AE/L43A